MHMRRVLVCAVATAALALPGQALGYGGDYVFDGGTPSEHAQVKAALDASAFDWGVVPERIVFHLRPNVPTGATPGHIWLDSELLDSGQFAWAVVQDEYAHQVDFFLFDHGVRARLLHALGGRDWCYSKRGLAHHEYGCERFASTLVWSYWPSKRNAYRPERPTDESAAMSPRRFRALVADVIGIRALASIRR